MARRKARSRASCVGADGDPIEVPADDAISRGSKRLKLK
jgi:hypothetical protein